MNEIDHDIHSAIHFNRDMLYFVLENIIRNDNIEAFKDLITDLTFNNIFNYNRDDLFEFFVYAINSINLNQTFPDYDTLTSFTIASYYINWIIEQTGVRWGVDPELFRPYINALFDTYIDMDAGKVSINDLLKITEPHRLSYKNRSKKTIRKMIDDKFAEDNMYRQSKSFISGLKPVLSVDSPLNLLDIETYRKIYDSLILPKPDIERKIPYEYTEDPLVKAEQKLAFARGISDPSSSIRITENHLRDNISEHISSHRPYPRVHMRYREDKLRNKSKPTRTFAKRTIKNRKKYKRKY
jgi:hypothetical protein